MEGIQGQEKSPGEFRYSQNWIGGQGSTIKNARYIPPNPDDMQTAMSDLEKYMNNDNTLDLLIQAALITINLKQFPPSLMEWTGRPLADYSFSNRKGHSLTSGVIYLRYLVSVTPYIFSTTTLQRFLQNAIP